MSIENERRYFKVLAGSPVLAAISEAETVKKTFTAAVDALRKEYPATEVWTGGASIVGLVLVPKEYGHGPVDSSGAPTCILRLLIAPPHRNSRITGGCKSRPEGRHPALGNPRRFPCTNIL